MFETKRLILRAPDMETDLNNLTRWDNDANNMSHISFHPLLPTTRESVKEQLKSQSNKSLPLFMVCQKPTGDNAWPKNLGPNDDYFKTAPPAIGFVNFQDKYFDFRSRIAYIGLSFPDKQHRGKGYGREVLEWSLEYGFMELGLHRIALEVYSFNQTAYKLYKSIGFVEEGRARKTYLKGGVWHDTVNMAILEEEWAEIRKKLPHVEELFEKYEAA